MSCIPLDIVEEEPTDALKKVIIQGLIQHSVETTGYDGDLTSFAFTLRNNGEFCGAIVSKALWGALHIRHLFISPDCRGQGMGRTLMEKAFERGKELHCHFAYVETLSFQALGFYQKLGFDLEFTRPGYDKGVSFHYLRKELT